MTYKEAADRIEEHMRIHYNNEYPYAIKITEALELAVNVLQKLALTEECVIKKGTPVWYVDFESGHIERGVVFSVQYKDQKVDSFSVDFEETGDFDEFYGDAIGHCFFLSEEMAKAELVRGIKDQFGGDKVEFSSYEDMKKFEAEREQFYLDFLDICHSFDPFRFKFYKRLFLESFHPKYRSQKKLYDGYYGGWWRDSDGRPCANPIQLIAIDSG